jgi:hypothetical protein
MRENDGSASLKIYCKHICVTMYSPVQLLYANKNSLLLNRKRKVIKKNEFYGGEF